MKIGTEKLQTRIDTLPREHEPTAYSVIISDRRGAYLSTRYVRASSKARAELVALKVERFIFGGRNAAAARAKRITYDKRQGS